MNRKMIIEFCNREIFPKCEAGSLDRAGMWDAVKMVQKWRVGKQNDVEMKPEVVNGFLFINGDPLGRIAIAPQKIGFTEEGTYYEGRILASAETCYD